MQSLWNQLFFLFYESQRFKRRQPLWCDHNRRQFESSTCDYLWWNRYRSTHLHISSLLLRGRNVCLLFNQLRWFQLLNLPNLQKSLKIGFRLRLNSDVKSRSSPAVIIDYLANNIHIKSTRFLWVTITDFCHLINIIVLPSSSINKKKRHFTLPRYQRLFERITFSVSLRDTAFIWTESSLTRIIACLEVLDQKGYFVSTRHFFCHKKLASLIQPLWIQ